MSKNIIDKISQKFKGGGLKYSLDQANTNEIVGWVFDPKSTSDHLEVQLREGDKFIATFKADEFRQDLLDAGIGSGHCGFHIDIQTLALDHSEGYFDLFTDGKKLNQLPIFIKVKVQTPPQQSVTLEHYKVLVDSNTPGKINGWATDNSRKAHKPHIECKLGELILGTCVADTFRDDLAKAGIGDGKHAFTIDYDVDLLPVGVAGLKVMVDGMILVDPEKSFSLSSADVQKAKDNKQQAIFVAGVKQEISAITQQISQHNMNEGLPADSVAGVCSVFVERIAELSFRLAVIEKALVEKLAKN
ncbi:MAG: hypothetical protein ACI93H_001203 [Psychromonas sp.]|jgi:hypothetical protein